MDANTISAVFTAATTAAHWKRTNLGLMADVNHGSYGWTVLLPGDGTTPVQAEITYRAGYGGTEYVGAVATWAQTIQLVESAMAATRVL
ncbi:hypothetical protein [Streptomyces murinus]|uniref:hypothetical protein n=1 Tax=Streptomyces murinus TaxID=33900 RepID=UPI0018F3D29E|nr:hypothetical protein [Streptomyces murinus]